MNDGVRTTIHLQHNFPFADKPNEWTFRIVVPGIDGGGAVWFEATVERDTQAEAIALMRECVPFLRQIEVDICECQTQDDNPPQIKTGAGGR